MWANIIEERRWESPCYFICIKVLIKWLNLRLSISLIFFWISGALQSPCLYILFQARKASYDLKGLVKLQAWVRGYLVRKKTAATLRRMQALISIQVREQAQRIQMAKKAHLVVKREPSIS